MAAHSERPSPKPASSNSESSSRTYSASQISGSTPPRRAAGTHRLLIQLGCASCSASEHAIGSSRCRRRKFERIGHHACSIAMLCFKRDRAHMFRQSRFPRRLDQRRRLYIRAVLGGQPRFTTPLHKPCWRVNSCTMASWSPNLSTVQDQGFIGGGAWPDYSRLRLKFQPKVAIGFRFLPVRPDLHKEI